MKKACSLFLALLLCLPTAACVSGDKDSGAANVVSGSGVMEFTSSSSVEELPPVAESPAAESSGSGTGGQVSRSASESTTKPEDPPATAGARPAVDEVRSVWISYLELKDLLPGQSDSQFRSSIGRMFDACVDFGLNTVVLQVRPFGDAIYPSQIFPQSYLFTGEEGRVGETPYDALQISIEEAGKRKLRLEAWINPYRVRNQSGHPFSEDNPVCALLKSGDAVQMGETVTYNPASKKAQDMIVAGVLEIVENYKVDGIHFDDYFYPTVDAAFDSGDYSAYKASGGTKELAAWRRSNVTTLVRKVHDGIKGAKSAVLFGISPQGNNSNNLNKQFVDVEEIVKAQLVDYICPQMYYGFQNSDCPYQSTLEAFNSMAKGTGVKVYTGLATYKFGSVDTWAGEGKNEWMGTTDILSRQLAGARKLSRYGGFVLYRYDSTFRYKSFYPGAGVQTQVETELANLHKLLSS